MFLNVNLLNFSLKLRYTVRSERDEVCYRVSSDHSGSTNQKWQKCDRPAGFYGGKVDLWTPWSHFCRETKHQWKIKTHPQGTHTPLHTCDGFPSVDQVTCSKLATDSCWQSNEVVSHHICVRELSFPESKPFAIVYCSFDTNCKYIKWSVMYIVPLLFPWQESEPFQSMFL